MKFADIPGQDTAKQRLREMVDSGRFPHALLIEGRPGIGKMALARATAQYIHCRNRHDGDSCGECPSCRQHQSFNHIDTFFSYPVVKRPSGGVTLSDDYSAEWRQFLSQNPYMDFSRWQVALGKPDGQPVIYVDESQELIRRLSFTSHEADYKIVLMWLPERMNEQCANKLLKLIEEPYEDTIFLLVSNAPGKILPTIYSRCQRLALRPLSDDQVTQWLVDQRGVETSQARAIAHLSEGSLIEAERQISLSARDREHLEWFKQLMRLAYQRDVAGLKKWSQDVAAAGREGAMQFLAYCQRLVRENFIYNLQQPTISYLNANEADFSKRFARFINERNVLSLEREIDQAIIDIAGNANAKIVFFDFAVKTIIMIKA